jgi:hypothetical protein
MSLNQILLIIHLFCIAMALGIGFSNIVGFRVAKGLGGDKALGIAAHRESLIPYVDIFFVLIIASGLILFSTKYAMHAPNVWFHVKMAAVLVWIIGYVLMRLRIRKFLATRDMSLVGLIRTFAHVAITGATLALVFAVMSFAT